MSKTEPDLSVLIPTRNRPSLAKVAALSALAALGPNDEVVVSDNGDQPLALNIDDRRLRVVRASRVLSMPENWDLALTSSRGAWTMVLADKFRLVPNVLKRLRESIPPDIKAATYARPMFWQSLAQTDALDAEKLISSPGTLTRSAAPTKMIEAAAAPALRRWFDLVTYLPELPMLYTALVHREVIAEARAKSGGTFFIGNAPDIASGLQILSNVTKFWQTNLPAVVVQIPNDPLNWSNGASQLVGGALSKEFEKEFGSSPFARRGLPNMISCGVFETLLAFHELRGPSSPRPSWRTLANQATREIEYHQKTGRLRQHIGLLRATQSPHPRPAAALEQLRMIGILRTYRVLCRVAPGLPRLVWRAKNVDMLDRRTEEATLGAAIARLEEESTC